MKELMCIRVIANFMFSEVLLKMIKMAIQVLRNQELRKTFHMAGSLPKNCKVLQLNLQSGWITVLTKMKMIFKTRIPLPHKNSRPSDQYPQVWKSRLKNSQNWHQNRLMEELKLEVKLQWSKQPEIIFQYIKQGNLNLILASIHKIRQLPHSWMESLLPPLKQIF